MIKKLLKQYLQQSYFKNMEQSSFKNMPIFGFFSKYDCCRYSIFNVFFIINSGIPTTHVIKYYSGWWYTLYYGDLTIHKAIMILTRCLNDNYFTQTFLYFFIYFTVLKICTTFLRGLFFAPYFSWPVFSPRLEHEVRRRMDTSMWWGAVKREDKNEYSIITVLFNF